VHIKVVNSRCRRTMKEFEKASPHGTVRLTSRKTSEKESCQESCCTGYISTQQMHSPMCGIIGNWGLNTLNKYTLPNFELAVQG